MKETEKRILCLGDSNTFGYDPCDTVNRRHPKLVRWTGRLESAGLSVFNRGMNGSMVPLSGAYSAFYELTGSLRPLDVITVMFGTNDILQGSSAEATAERTAQFLDAMTACAENAALLLIAPPPVTFGDWVQSEAVIRESEKLAAFYETIAEERHLAFADAGQWKIGLVFDGVHFSPVGHAAFFNGLYETMKTML